VSSRVSEAPLSPQLTKGTAAHSATANPKILFMTPPRLKAFGCLMRRLGSVSGQGERQCGSGMNIGRIVRPERVEVKGNGILL
jgi:hypothetical protein